MIWITIPVRAAEVEQLHAVAENVAQRLGHPTAPPTPEAVASALLRAALHPPVLVRLLERIATANHADTGD